MAAQLKWFGDAVKQRVTRAAMERSKDAAEHLAGQVREAISDPSPPRSDPGRPPHAETQALLRSIRVYEEGRGYRVSTSNPYAKFLEFGTRFMAARPFFSATIERAKSRLGQILRRR